MGDESELNKSGNSTSSSESPIKEEDSTRKKLKKLIKTCGRDDHKNILLQAYQDIKRLKNDLEFTRHDLQKAMERNNEIEKKIIAQAQETQKEIDLKNKEHENYVKAYSLLSIRLYLEQLKREFKEGSKAPNKDQMIIDLEGAGETIAFTDVSIHYVEWLWYLKFLKYGPAKVLHQLVKRNFPEDGDFVELLSHLWKEVSVPVHHPLDPLTCDEIKRGLSFYGLASTRMDVAIDILFQLKKESPKKKRAKSSKRLESEPKKVKLDRSKFQSETDSSAVET